MSEGDVNPSLPTCAFPGCRTSASFCPAGGKKPARCSSHRIEGDITFWRRASCGVSSCGEKALFLDEGSGVKHCLAHYDSSTDTGILNLMCQEKGCTRHATFGEVKNRALRCAEHKFATDRDVVNTMCAREGCGKRPSFAPAGSSAKRCKTHSVDGDVNVNGKRCSSADCDTIVAKKGARCWQHSLVIA